MTGPTTATLIAECRAALAVADAAEQQTADSRQMESDARWEAAERMKALVDRGKSQREIGAAVGVSLATVSRYLTCLQRSGESVSVRKQQLFGDVMREIRGGWGHAPTSIEGKAKAVAELISDPDVWASPQVLKAADKAQAERIAAGRLPPPSRKPPPGLLAAGVSLRASYWTKLRHHGDDFERLVADAFTEIGRSGAPGAESGDIIRGIRRWRKALDRLEARLTETAIGQPLNGK